jgi:hypothetical protein
MVAERLQQIDEELQALREQRKIAPSPGLTEAIRRLEWRQQNFVEAREMWKIVERR